MPDVTARDVMTGLAAGLIGGLAGAWAMNQVSPVVSKVRRLVAGDAASSGSGGGGESSTVTVARFVSTRVLGRDLPPGREAAAGNAVHYAFGALNGAWYGAAAALAPGIARGRGLLFGAAVWAGADEAMLPLIGLAQGPRHYPLSTHALALSGHLVYGVATDVVRRMIERRAGGRRAGRMPAAALAAAGRAA